VAGIGPVSEVDYCPDLPKASRPGGLLAAVGMMRGWDSMQADVESIMVVRDEDRERSLPESVFD
jgi:hypothetical protein